MPQRTRAERECPRSIMDHAESPRSFKREGRRGDGRTRCEMLRSPRLNSSESDSVNGTSECGTRWADFNVFRVG